MLKSLFLVLWDIVLVLLFIGISMVLWPLTVAILGLYLPLLLISAVVGVFRFSTIKKASKKALRNPKKGVVFVSGKLEAVGGKSEEIFSSVSFGRTTRFIFFDWLYDRVIVSKLVCPATVNYRETKYLLTPEDWSQESRVKPIIGGKEMQRQKFVFLAPAKKEIVKKLSGFSSKVKEVLQETGLQEKFKPSSGWRSLAFVLNPQKHIFLGFTKSTIYAGQTVSVYGKIESLEKPIKGIEKKLVPLPRTFNYEQKHGVSIVSEGNLNQYKKRMEKALLNTALTIAIIVAYILLLLSQKLFYLAIPL